MFRWTVVICKKQECVDSRFFLSVSRLNLFYLCQLGLIQLRVVLLGTVIKLYTLLFDLEVLYSMNLTFRVLVNIHNVKHTKQSSVLKFVQ